MFPAAPCASQPVHRPPPSRSDPANDLRPSTPLPFRRPCSRPLPKTTKRGSRSHRWVTNQAYPVCSDVASRLEQCGNCCGGRSWLGARRRSARSNSRALKHHKEERFAPFVERESRGLRSPSPTTAGIKGSMVRSSSSSRVAKVARYPLLRRAVRGAGVEVAVGRADGILGSGFRRTPENCQTSELQRTP